MGRGFCQLHLLPYPVSSSSVCRLSLAVLAATAVTLLKADESAGRTVPFNAGWAFLRAEAPGAESPTFDDSSWRRLDLPHDWSIEDLPAISGAQPFDLDAVTGSWRFQPGDNLAWKEPAFNDTSWPEHRLPAGWRALRGGDYENSFGWYRRKLPAQPASSGRAITLQFGKIDDADEVFVNGTRIGATGGMPPNYASAWTVERNYAVPAGLLKLDGSDVIAVRVYNGGSDGGMLSASVQPRQRIGPFDTFASEGGPATGYMVGGIGWYRRTFDRDAAWAGKHVEIRFDGVYRNSTVWLNGVPVASHAYGYTPFGADLTPYLKAKGNILAVRVANTGVNSRWYSGSGIYRDVELVVTDPVAIPVWGVAITTPDIDDKRARTRVAVTVANRSAIRAEAVVAVRILDGSGKPVAVASSAALAVPAGTEQVVELLADITEPRLWSLTDPHLYQAETRILVAGREVDRTVTNFGVRTTSFDSTHGFRLNGESLKLHGGCIHHDNGPLGAVSIRAAEERRVALLKARGFNAVRLSHNPPSELFLEACDKLGLLVIDEAFDMWRESKNPDDYHLDFPSNALADIDAMVLRSRNCPSIIAWSIGNEIPERFTERGVLTAKSLAGRIRSLDPTRPVTQGLNGEWKEDIEQAVTDQLDIVGYNYQLQRYVKDHVSDPKRVIFASESFPLYAAEHWFGVIDHAHVIGDFVWTAIDYLGEAGCGFNLPKGPAPFYQMQPFPMFTGNTGDLDICGFQRPQSLFRDVLWDVRPLAIVVDRPRPPGVTSNPNAWGWHDVEARWNWNVPEGTPLKVQVYARAEKVELYQDGKLIGSAPAGRDQKYIANFTVPWRPGTLRAVIHREGFTAETSLSSSGPAAALRLTPEQPALGATRGALAYVRVEVVDAQGRIVPGAVVPVDFTVSGSARLRATGNGNASDPASFTAPSRRTWNGQALVILQPTGAGHIELRAIAPGLTPAVLKLNAR